VDYGRNRSAGARFESLLARNAFAHAYISAYLTTVYGYEAAWAAGYALELKNHLYDYRNDNNPNDPNQRKDSFKDLYNNAFGRDVALLGAKNDRSFETITSVIAQGVRDGVAIVDHLDPNDARIPSNLGQFSTLDYLLGVTDPAQMNYPQSLTVPEGTDFNAPRPDQTAFLVYLRYIGIIVDVVGDAAADLGTKLWTHWLGSSTQSWMA
jgi:hypothetical protein